MDRRKFAKQLKKTVYEKKNHPVFFYNRNHYPRRTLLRCISGIQPEAYTISGAEIIKAFSADEKAANSKYLDKVIAINGTVKSVDKDEQSSITVILSDAGSMSSVRCSVDSIHNEQADNLVSGSQVTVKGVCTGFNADELLGSDVILNRCSIKKINNN